MSSTTTSEIGQAIETIDRGNIKVIQMTSAHPWGDTRIFVKECRYLADNGYDVTLLANGIDEDVGSEEAHGVQVIRLRKPKNRLVRILAFPWRMLKSALSLKGQVYHFHDPELLPIGVALKLIRGKKVRVLYDVHEHLPKQVEDKPWVPKALRKPLSKFINFAEMSMAKMLDGVVAAEPQLVDRFTRTKNVTLVQNYPSLTEFDLTVLPKWEDREDLVTYIGGISHDRGAIIMIDAIEKVAQKAALRNETVQLILGGKLQDQSQLMKDCQSSPGWKHVDFRGWQSRDQVVDVLRKSKVGMVTLKPIANYVEAFPVKMFEYMASGLPVVASDFPLWRQIVEDAGCGLVVDPLDNDAVAEAVDWLLTHPIEAAQMGANGQKAILEKYNWENEFLRLDQGYQKMFGAV